MSGKETQKNIFDYIGTYLPAVAAGAMVNKATQLYFGADPIFGHAIGAMAGDAIKTAIEDFSASHLSKREKARGGALAAYAITEIRQKVDAGATLRTDGFFSKAAGNTRSSAEEIFEGVLLRAKREHEERKLPYLARLYKNVCFRTDISAEDANHLIKIAETLSYRQLCALAIFSSDDPHYRGKFRQADYSKENEKLLSSIIPLLSEIYDLSERGFIAHAGKLIHWVWIEPAKAKLSTLGRIFFDLMELDKIPASDRMEIEKALSK